MQLVMRFAMHFADCKNEMYSGGYAFGYAFRFVFFSFQPHKLPKIGQKQGVFGCFRGAK